MSRREELLKDIREIKAQYRAEVPGKHQAWPKSVKTRVEELLRLGMTSTAVSQATGIAYYTVHNWKRRSVGFRPVAIQAAKEVTVPSPPVPILFVTVTLPNGVKIEGLPAVEAFSLARSFR